MKIEGKIAIVTGGASGLGKATAEALVAAGAKVVIWDMNEDNGKAVAAELGENACFMKINVTDEAAGKDWWQICLHLLLLRWWTGCNGDH